MEVMQRAVVKSRTLKPLPGEITDARIRDAALPLKVEAARRAIAACTDLPELMVMKDQAEGLAAAVRVMKTVAPEMVANANRMVKETIVRTGELLKSYKSSCERQGKHLRRMYGGTDTLGKSEQRQVAEQYGISEELRLKSVKIALAPKEVRERILSDAAIPANVTAMSRYAPPRVGSENQGKHRHSDIMRIILNGLDITTGHRGSGGLNQSFASLQRVPLDLIPQLTPDERKIVKAKITEIVELLDEMDRLCR